jgi:hypothetical protein
MQRFGIITLSVKLAAWESTFTRTSFRTLAIKRMAKADWRSKQVN